MAQSPRLIVFSGLPGSGKSTLAQRLALYLGAAYLRLDSIEAALLNAADRRATVEGYAVAYALAADRRATVEGYAVAYALAADQLELGLSVVADCVNPLEVTRDTWAAVAAEVGCPLLNIEVVCSDPAEHRRRVEARQADITTYAGRWQPPTWEKVQARTHEYAPWASSRMVIDTAGNTPDALFAVVLSQLKV